MTSDRPTPTELGLRWKLILPGPLLLLLGLGVVLAYVPGRLEADSTETSVHNAMQTVRQFKAIRGYYTKNVIKKVLAQSDLRPSAGHAEDPKGVPLPATVIHDVSALLEKEKTRLRLYSAYPFPNRADRKLDAFQQEAWDHLRAHPEAVFVREEQRDGHRYVRVAMADFMAAAGCVSCHNSHPDTPKSDWKLGDVRGVLEVETEVDEAFARADALGFDLSLLFGGLLVVLALLMAAVARHVSTPLSHLTRAAQALASGDLEHETPDTERGDEIGELARALEVFRDNARGRAALEAAEASARAQAEASEQALAEERARAERSRRDQMTHVAKDLEVTVGQVVQNVSRSAREMQALATSLRDRSGDTQQAVQDVLSSAERSGSMASTVATAASQLRNSIDEIAEQVTEASQQTSRAVEDIGGSASTMTQLDESARRIGQVVDLISEIADQTNLLALNATIEAASAGDAGRGFAVVAGEVKALAAQSAGATAEISEQVASIQQASRSVAELIQRLRSSVANIDTIAHAVAAAVEEQGAATQEITHSIELAAQGADHVQRLAGDVSTAAQESGAAAETIRGSVDALSEQTTVLEDEVHRFADTVRAA